MYVYFPCQLLNLSTLALKKLSKMPGILKDNNLWGLQLSALFSETTPLLLMISRFKHDLLLWFSGDD